MPSAREEQLRKVRDMRRIVARELSSWPSSLCGAVRSFTPPVGWDWRYSLSGEAELVLLDTPYRITRVMWQADEEELPQQEVNTRVPPKGFDTLTELVEAVATKPLTSWQRRQLVSWDSQIERKPPNFNPVLNVGVSEQDRERRWQINRIATVCSATTNAATHMYDQGVRIIEQE